MKSQSTTIRLQHQACSTACLLIVDENHQERHVLPTTGELTIGRSSDVDITINDDSVSRKHATIRTGNASITTIEDLGSANGTKVQGVAIPPGEHQRLARYDLIEIGSVQIVLQYIDHPARTRVLCPQSEFESRASEACSRASRDASALALVRVTEISPDVYDALTLQLAEILDSEDIVTEIDSGQVEFIVSSRDHNEVVDQLRASFATLKITPQLSIAVHGQDGISASTLVTRLRGRRNAATRTQLLPLATQDMKALYSLATKLAPSNIAMLIIGEEGTGKTTLARYIHQNSSNPDENLHIVDCALFRGAQSARNLFGDGGIQKLSSQSTLLLENIDVLDFEQQEKLNAYLDDEACVPRMLATIRHPIDEFLASGMFRTDLYYRLCGLSLDVPPLRQRREDLFSLARHFLSPLSQTSNIALDKSVEELLCNYSWPGNIRELQNVIELAALLAGGSKLTVEHFPEKKMRATLSIANEEASSAQPAKPGLRAPTMTKEQIARALEKCGGNQTRAAAELQVSRRTLSKWIGRFGLPRPRK